MDKILQSIENETKLRCYRTVKYSLDSTSAPIIQYDDSEKLNISVKQKYAETDKSKVKHIDLEQKAERELGFPIFKYFLDGSRKTYKVDDIAIGDRIYPLVAGQISVGCCYRMDDSFKTVDSQRMIVLAVPDRINIDDLPEKEFLRDLCDVVNTSSVLKKTGVEINKIFQYPTDSLKAKSLLLNKSDKEKYEDLAVMCIQNEMMDTEQLVVKELCRRNLLNDNAYLIKDGSLEYSHRHSNMHKNEFLKYRENYRHVIGVSKSFNPELITDDKKSIARTISELLPFHRTKAYFYPFENNVFAIWYMRLRSNVMCDNQFAGVVKVEILLATSEEQEFGLPTDVVDLISVNLINERNPVCFGKDSRWANHIYPISLTETFLKSQYLSNDFFLNLF